MKKRIKNIACTLSAALIITGSTTACSINNYSSKPPLTGMPDYYNPNVTITEYETASSWKDNLFKAGEVVSPKVLDEYMFDGIFVYKYKSDDNIYLNLYSPNKLTGQEMSNYKECEFLEMKNTCLAVYQDAEGLTFVSEHKVPKTTLIGIINGNDKCIYTFVDDNGIRYVEDEQTLRAMIHEGQVIDFSLYTDEIARKSNQSFLECEKSILERPQPTELYYDELENKDVIVANQNSERSISPVGTEDPVYLYNQDGYHLENWYDLLSKINSSSAGIGPVGIYNKKAYENIGNSIYDLTDIDLERGTK